MNFILIITVFIIDISTATFYPCERTDHFQCDLCRCFPPSSTRNSSSNGLCALIDRLDCSLDDVSISNSNSQLELKHFNDRTIEFLFQRTTFCSSWFFTEFVLVNFHSDRFISPLPTCLFTVDSFRLKNSILRDATSLKDFHLRQFYLINSTLNLNEMNFSTIEILSIHSFENIFILNSSTTLTHLTISETFDYDLSGSFPHLSYLNLARTNLTNWRWNELLSRVQFPDLNTLILRENLLTSITNKFPSTIRFLDLSQNQIHSLDYFSFKSLYSLNILNLTANSPLNIQTDTFTRIPYLEILDLSQTNLSHVDDDLFLPLQKLRFLNLSSNQFERLPSLPIPYDVHSIDSYDQYLPVLDVDLSMNKFENFSKEIFSFSSSSTQDKYILTIHLRRNQIKTWNFFLTETKRRGPFIELDLRENPFECNCHLFDVVSNLFKSESKTFVNRLKFLYFTELTCSTKRIFPLKSSRFVDLRASDSFCSYNVTCCSSSSCSCEIRCPKNCFCAHSADWTINHVNCSATNLTEIPVDLPSTTTHLDFNHNQIKQIDQRLKILLNLKSLSLAHNHLKTLVDQSFSSLTRLEYLDLSSNRIETISSNTFVSLVELKELHLDENPWIPQFDSSSNLFQTNLRLNRLTYGSNWICNRSIVDEPISRQICCSSSLQNPSCQPMNFPNDTEISHPKNLFAFRNDSTSISSKSFEEKLRSIFFYSSTISLIVLLAIVLLIFYQKKRSFFSKNKFFSQQELNKKSNAYDKPLIIDRIPNSHSNTIYDHSQTIPHPSSSITDDDDYASIPLTNSQTDLALPIRTVAPLVPPLPPPRQFTLQRSTPIQIKLDVLVLYSINDCEFIHQNVSVALERLYGQRYTFHFIHRDRMLGDLHWLITNSCLTLLILKKPHHILRDYIKLFSSYSKLKCFIIFISSDSFDRTVSLKCREKLAHLYRTSNIFEWNCNPNSLIHEQLDLFLELNCTATNSLSD